MQEHGSRFLEFLHRFRGQKLAAVVLGTPFVHIRMPFQIVFQTVADIFSLCYQADVCGCVLPDLLVEQGLVCTSQYDGIYFRVFFQQVIHVLLDEIVGSRRIEFIVFHQGYPKRAGHTGNLDVWIELMDFQRVRFGFDGTCCCQNTYMTCFRQFSKRFGCRTDNSQYTTLRRQVWQIILLNAAERFGRSRIAG